MSNEIIFKFNDDLEVLAGNPFGVETYNKQLKGKFSVDGINKLVFPSTVRMICSSFVQGLMKEYLELMTPAELEKHIQIDNEDQKNDFIEGLND